MKLLDDVEKFYDKVFGNNDGRFDIKDLPKGAPAIVVGVVDIAMIVAEYRVYSVGLHLTGNPLLALGFVMVSSVPFYLGELAFLYNLANVYQKIISVLMVLMGLGISGFFGFAELLTGTTVNAGIANINPIDPTTLYYIAIGGTIALILSGLMFGLVDDEIAQNLKAARIRARANASKHEMKIKAELLEEVKKLRLQEGELRGQYIEDYDYVDRQFHKDKLKKNGQDNNLNHGNQQNNHRPQNNQNQEKSNIRTNQRNDYESQPEKVLEKNQETRTIKAPDKKSVFEERQQQVRAFPSDKSNPDVDEDSPTVPLQ